MAFNRSKYKIIPVTGVGRGEQGREFSMTSDDTLGEITTPGYLNDYLGVPHSELLSRPLVNGDLIFCQLTNNGDPFWMFLTVFYDPTEDTYTLVLQEPGYKTKTATASFEPNGEGTKKVYFETAATIFKVIWIVDKVVAGPDAGTIQFKDSTGADMGDGLITVAGDSFVGAEGTIDPSSNNKVAAGGYIEYESTRPTPGGDVSLFIEYR